MIKDLKKLQPRQIEWLYWLSQGRNKYGAAREMGLSNNSIPPRQNKIRYKLGLNKHSGLQFIAKRHKRWLESNAIVRGKLV